MTDEQAKTVIQELTIIRKLIYTYGLGEDIPGGPSPGILAGIKDEIHELRESLEGTPLERRPMKPTTELDERDMMLILTLCELLGKSVRVREVEKAYSKVRKQAENDVLRRYTKDSEDQD